MSIRINDTSPDFSAETTNGVISFHEWIGDSWCVLVSHPKDFTPICTTEIGLMAKIESEFSSRNIKFIAHSIDSVDDHYRWIYDIVATQGVRPNFPIIGDDSLRVAKLYDMLPQEAEPGTRTAAQNATVRAVYVIDPSKKIRAMTFYPMVAGRNFDEILRLVDAIQLADKYKVATPVNWKSGEPLLIQPSISDDEATKLFPQGWTTEKPGGGDVSTQRRYLRYVNV